MATEKKKRRVNRVQTATSIDIKLLRTLDKLTQETRIPKSKLYDEALELLFAKHGIEIVEDEEVTE